MTKYTIGDFFNTRVEEKNGEKKLYIYHMEGCQTLDFGDAPTLPRQSEVLTALKVAGIDMTKIMALQYGGRNKYIMYPKSNEPALIQQTLTLNGQIVKVSITEPIIRDMKPTTMDVFISGLPIEVRSSVFIEKLMTTHKINVLQEKKAQAYGHEGVYTGERIIKVPLAELKHIPAYFYILGFLCRSWYKGCEKDRPCQKCREIGHSAKMCTKVFSKPDPQSYAGKVATNIPTDPPGNGNGQTLDENEEREVEREQETLPLSVPN